MRREDAIRLRHMLDAAEQAREFMEGRARQELEHNRMLSFAVVRALEVLGEAASRVSAQAREAHPDLPWQAMAGMRNRLVHAYFDIDLDRVWDTVTDDLPGLAAQLRAILARESGAKPPER
jgi:uncharacterized protein with HEPN domain